MAKPICHPEGSSPKDLTETKVAVRSFTTVQDDKLNKDIERSFIALCIEVAKGNIGGERFTTLLLKTGILLDETEWDAANKLLEKSECYQIINLL